MKRFFLAFLFFYVTSIVSSQTVSIDSLHLYEGKKVTVCTEVKGIYVSNKTKKTTFINFGKPYPNHTFVVVIFEKDLVNFSYDPSKKLKDKKICITGIVKMYKGLPEIIATKEEQIVINN